MQAALKILPGGTGGGRGGFFVPKGAEAEWRLLYNVIKDYTMGAVIPFSVLDGALGRSFRKSRTPLYRAIHEFETSHGLTLVPRKNVGYIVAEPNDNIVVGTKRIKRSRRQLRKGAHTVGCTDRNELTKENRKVQERMNAWFKFEIRRLTVRQAQTERKLQKEVKDRETGDKRLARKVAEMQSNISEFQRTLDRLRKEAE